VRIHGEYVPGPADGFCAGGCAGRHRPGRLMCPACWARVPAELRREVLVAWWAWWTTSHARGAACARRHEIRTRRNTYRRAARRALEVAQGREWRTVDGHLLDVIRRSA